jgi:hypothetical protein
MAYPPSGEQPQQPPYGDQPYSGQPPSDNPPPYGSGGYYPPPPKQGNGFAIAGIILAILAPLFGLIFSIIGLTKSKARAGAGRTLSIVGIVVSVIVMGGAVAAIAVVGKSTAADPGCVSAESAARQMTSTLNADETAMSRDQSNSSAERTDLQKFVTDMSTLTTKWSAAEAQAQHQSVKAQIAAVISDMGTFNSSLQAVAQGQANQVSPMEAAATKVQNDGNTLDSTCSSL